MIKAIYGILMFFVSSLAWGHGGVSNDGNQCRLSVGPYLMNFSGYQPSGNLSKRFCDDMPTVGKSIIVLDFIDNKLRDMAVSFRVINSDTAPLGTADDGKVNDAELAQEALFEMPSKRYGSGTMTITQEFKEKGHFVGYVIVEDKNEKFISRFPFSVGYEDEGIPKALRFPIAVFTVVIIIMIWFALKKPAVVTEKKEN